MLSEDFEKKNGSRFLRILQYLFTLLICDIENEEIKGWSTGKLCSMGTSSRFRTRTRTRYDTYPLWVCVPFTKITKSCRFLFPYPNPHPYPYPSMCNLAGKHCHVPSSTCALPYIIVDLILKISVTKIISQHHKALLSSRRGEGNGPSDERRLGLRGT